MYKPDKEVDARRLLCPLPILRAEAAMSTLKTGQLLAVRATDPGLTNDLPAWCKINGHRLLEMKKEGWEWVGLVVKG